MLARLLRAFSTFRKGKPEAVAMDPQARRAALVNLPAGNASGARLVDVASNDPDASVRDAALQLIEDPAALFALCERETARPAALRRLAALAAAGKAEQILNARPDLAQALLNSTQDQAFAERMLAGIRAEPLLLQVAQEAESPRTRLLAAARIEDEALLLQLERSSRSSDKNVHRSTKERLDHRRALRSQADTHCDAFHALQQRARQLQNVQHDPQLSARIEVLQRSVAQWQSHAEGLQQRLLSNPDSIDAQNRLAACAVADLQATLRIMLEAAHAQTLARQQQPVDAPDAADAAHRRFDATSTQAAPDPSAPTPSTALDDDQASPAAAAMSAEDAALAAAERAEVLQGLRAIHADVLAAGDAILDRLALVSPALQIMQRRWSSASATAPGSRATTAAATAEQQDYDALMRLLRDGAGAAQQVDQAAPELRRLNISPPAVDQAADDARAAASADATASAPQLDVAALSNGAPTHEHSPETWQSFWRDLQQGQKSLGRVQALQRRLQWPTALPRPQVFVALQNEATRLQAQQMLGETTLAALLPRAEAALTLLENTADSGQLRNAQQQLNDTRRLVRSLPGSVAQPLQGRLQLLTGRVQEMRDWQDYATHPKREALCARMEALAAEPVTDHEARADRIKSLRSEWQALGPPGSNSERALADRFNAHAQTAFEPCREYFDGLAALRASNLGERERVLSTLTGYLEQTDWAHADWKLAQQVLRVAREEFLSFSPVESVARREQGKRFDNAADHLHALIKAEFDRNLHTKEQIVAEAAAMVAGLAELLDAPEQQSVDARNPRLETHIQRAKTLQQDWRAIGITPRGPDQKLWRTFRAHCDAIFNARETVRVAQTEAAESDASRAEGVLELLEARVQDDEQPITDDVQLQSFIDQFEAIPLSKERVRVLGRRMREAEQIYLQRLRAHQQQGRRDNLSRWLRLHDELLRSERAHAEAIGAGRDAATVVWPSEEFEGASAAIAARRERALADAQSNPASDSPTAEAPARAPRPEAGRWLLFAEILAAIESPEEDRAARLELQVARLSSSMSSSPRGQRIEAETSMVDVLRNWVAAATDAPDNARQRVQRALDAYLS